GVADFGKYVTFGASPRASIHLIEGARALAFLRGRDYVLPDDVSDLAPDVLRHRLVLSYEALADGLTPDQLVHKIMQRIPPPEKPLETHVRIGKQGCPAAGDADQRRRTAGAQRRERAAPPRVDGAAPARRPVARRLPD